jgi:hypothetical protein
MKGGDARTAAPVRVGAGSKQSVDYSKMSGARRGDNGTVSGSPVVADTTAIWINAAAKVAANGSYVAPFGRGQKCIEPRSLLLGPEWRTRLSPRRFDRCTAHLRGLGPAILGGICDDQEGSNDQR